MVLPQRYQDNAGFDYLMCCGVELASSSPVEARPHFLAPYKQLLIKYTAVGPGGSRELDTFAMQGQ